MIIRKIKDTAAFFAAPADELELHNIDRVNWPQAFPYAPAVKFAIAHTGTKICLRFFVDERSTMARVSEDNGRVWTDSCVEFFIKFDDSGYYYNFEFNCIGTALLGWRKVIPEAEHAGAAIMSTIKRTSTLGNRPFEERVGETHWEIAVEIPVTAFFKHDIRDLSGIRTTANFYKCGDELSVPHFLSWAPIDTPAPSFHTVQFFAPVEFE